jgi:hypothetical protein
MKHIYIEAESKKTTEYNFLKAIIKKILPNKRENDDFEFKFLAGVENLFSEKASNIQTIQKAQEEGIDIIVIVDADTLAKDWGYEKRKNQIEKGMHNNNISFSYFVYPNNQDDGDVETLMEAAALHAPNQIFFDCYTDYETCLKSKKDSNGESIYNVPCLKGKMYAYAEAQTIYDIQQKQRIPLINRTSKGNWLFDNPNYWDLDVDALQSLKDFLEQNLK